VLGALACIAGAAGCSSYVLQGHVVEGASSEMSIVAAGDPRLEGRPVPGVLVAVMRGGDKAPGRLAGTDVSDTRGRIAIPLEHVGGRFLEQPWEIHASRAGYRTASMTRRLSDPEARLLVTMAPQDAAVEGGQRP
jgi:hypothetical protein